MFRAVTSNLRDASVASGLDSCNLGNAGHQRQVSPLASQPASCESGDSERERLRAAPAAQRLWDPGIRRKQRFRQPGPAGARAWKGREESEETETPSSQRQGHRPACPSKGSSWPLASQKIDSLSASLTFPQSQTMRR